MSDFIGVSVEKIEAAYYASRQDALLGRRILMLTIDDEVRIFDGVMIPCLNQDVVQLEKQGSKF